MQHQQTFKMLIYTALLFLVTYLLKDFGKNFSPLVLIQNLRGFSILCCFFFLLYHLPRHLRTLLSLIFLSVSILVFIIDIFCLYIFGSPLNSTMLFSAFETTYQESRDFLGMYLDYKIILFWLCFVILSLFFFKIKFKLSKKIFSLVFLPTITCGAIALFYELYLICFSNTYTCQYRGHISFISPIRIFCQAKLTLDEIKETSKRLNTFSLRGGGCRSKISFF